MGNLKWEDATSYSRGQRGKVAQTAWEAEVHGVRLFVSSGHRYYPDEWMMSCRELGIDEKAIGPKDALTSEDARDAAVEIAWYAARDIAAKMTGVADTLFSVPSLSPANPKTQSPPAP